MSFVQHVVNKKMQYYHPPPQKSFRTKSLLEKFFLPYSEFKDLTHRNEHTRGLSFIDRVSHICVFLVAINPLISAIIFGGVVLLAEILVVIIYNKIGIIEALDGPIDLSVFVSVLGILLSFLIGFAYSNQYSQIITCRGIIDASRHLVAEFTMGFVVPQLQKDTLVYRNIMAAIETFHHASTREELAAAAYAIRHAYYGFVEGKIDITKVTSAWTNEIQALYTQVNMGRACGIASLRHWILGIMLLFYIFIFPISMFSQNITFTNALVSMYLSTVVNFFLFFVVYNVIARNLVYAHEAKREIDAMGIYYSMDKQRLQPHFSTLN